MVWMLCPCATVGRPATNIPITASTPATPTLLILCCFMVRSLLLDSCFLVRSFPCSILGHSGTAGRGVEVGVIVVIRTSLGLCEQVRREFVHLLSPRRPHGSGAAPLRSRL